MPYVTKATRYELEFQPPMSAGELAYVLSREVERYRQLAGDSYQTFADVLAALESTRHEFQRQVVDPYEDNKIEENGPVFAPVERRTT